MLSSKKMILLVCGFLISANAFAQNKGISVFINNGVDTANVEITQVIRLWENYLNSRPDSIYDNPYWSKAEKLHYEDWDLLRSSFSPNLYTLMRGYKPTILSVSEIDGGWKLRTLFSTHTDSGFANPLCIITVVAKKENGEYRLHNALLINEQSWDRKEVGSITYIYPPEHKFDLKLASRMNRFVDSLAVLFNTATIPVEYYFADDFNKVQRLRGLEYYMGEGNQRRVTGRTDVLNRIIYAGGANEWFPHEFVHIYAAPWCHNSHYYFGEGLATLLGGEGNKPLEFHIKRMNAYLQNHPEVDLDDLFSFWHMDAITDPTYVFGGILCLMAQEKGGLELVKRLMSYGRKEEDFYKAVEEVFGIKRDDLNAFLRRKIKEYAEKG